MAQRRACLRKPFGLPHATLELGAQHVGEFVDGRLGGTCGNAYKVVVEVKSPQSFTVRVVHRLQDNPPTWWRRLLWQRLPVTGCGRSHGAQPQSVQVDAASTIAQRASADKHAGATLTRSPAHVQPQREHEGLSTRILASWSSSSNDKHAIQRSRGDVFRRLKEPGAQRWTR